MKPPKNLVAAEDDTNGRKAAGSRFGGDSFRHYMARKIELQRNQFGLVLPPDPQERADSEKKGNKRKGAKVRFSDDIEIFEFSSEQNSRKKRKKNISSRNRGPLTVLERLQQKHEKEGTNSKQSERLRKRVRRKSRKESIEKDTHTIETLRNDSGKEADDRYNGDSVVGEDSSVVIAESESKCKATNQKRSLMSPRQRPDLFFYGVVVLVNGFTEPDAGTLQRMIQKHGGDLEKYETSRVTHIIAEHLSTAKANMYKRQRRPTPVCRPQWIVDSVNSFRLLPYADYLLDEVRDENLGMKTVKAFFSSPQEKRTRDSADDVNSRGDSSAKFQSPKQERQSLSQKNHKIYRATDEKFMSVEAATLSEPLQQLGTETAIKPVGKASGTRRSADEPEIDMYNLGPCDGNEKKTDNTMKTDNITVAGKVRTTGTDPNFLESYFSSSRLSFIGSFKQRSKPSPTKTSSKRTVRSGPSHRFVFHVDMDCFFASVVLRNYPELRRKPVAISHCGGDAQHVSTRSTSECATCNYEARKYGIKKGMFLGQARELCPDLVVLQYDFEGYEEVSEQVADILYRHSEAYNGAVEQVSCDEAYMEMFIPLDDEAGAPNTKAKEIAETIRNDIFCATHCTASVGVAENKLLARLATDRVKPDKSFVVENFREILAPLKLRDLPGIGYKKERELNAEGLVTVRDVRELNDQAESELNRILGQLTGKKIFNFCNGIDDTPVKPVLRKSIGAECNYGVRFDGMYGVDHMMSGLAKEVQKRMERVGVRGSRLTLKVKQRKKGAKPPPKFLGHGSCHNHSKSSNIELTCDWRMLSQLGMVLFGELGIPKDDVRGMGLVVSKLDNESSAKGISCARGGITEFFRSAKQTQTGNIKNKMTSEGHQRSDNDNECADRPDMSRKHVPLERDGRTSPSTVTTKSPIQDDFPSCTQREDVVTESDGGSQSLSQTGDLIVIDVPRSPYCSGTVQDHQEEATFNLLSTPLGEEVYTKNQNCFITEVPPGTGSAPSDDDDDDDVALPSLSQIHMSQVMALPSPLRNHVISKMGSAPQHGSGSDLDEVKTNTISVARTMKSMTSPEHQRREPNVLADECSRFRQVSVKRMMKLAAVKNGQDSLSESLGDAVSLTQLESLPLEVQLQVANNDDFHIGVLSPSKRRGKLRLVNQCVTTKDTADRDEEEESVGNGVHWGSCEREICTETPVDATDEAVACARYASGSFYEEQILPLQDWMDSHPHPNIDDIGQIREFLALVVSENRIDDAIAMLRSIRERNDEWSTPRIYEEELLRIVVQEYGQAPFGGVLDTKWLRLS